MTALSLNEIKFFPQGWTPKPYKSRQYLLGNMFSVWNFLGGAGMNRNSCEWLSEKSLRLCCWLQLCDLSRWTYVKNSLVRVLPLNAVSFLHELIFALSPVSWKWSSLDSTRMKGVGSRQEWTPSLSVLRLSLHVSRFPMPTMPNTGSLRRKGVLKAFCTQPDSRRKAPRP